MVKSLISILNEKCEVFSGRVALSYEGENITYADLALKSSLLAEKLAGMGVKRNSIVGISLPRSIDMVVSIMGILKTGAAYLPLDTSYPVERLSFMLEDSRCRYLIGAEEFVVSFASKKTNVTTLVPPFDFTGLSGKFEDAEDFDLCYIIYTSGSTGQPKGVAMGHKALSNLVNWQVHESNKVEDPVTLQFSPVSFDVHFQEIFSSLFLGGRLELVSEDIRLNSIKLLEFIEDKKITRLFLPFVALNHLAEIAVKYNRYPTTLKEIVTAGEQLKITSNLKKFFEKLECASLHNHYGPSETHVVTAYTMPPDSTEWETLPPIGKPLPGCTCFILDEKMDEVGNRKEGELYIGGVCLANGYINNTVLTSERFLNHPVYGRIYKTGDLVHSEADGNLRYVSRIDGQVKIRGYRIETGEIETVLKNHPGISDVCVKVVEVNNGVKFLCAYLVGDFKVEEIRRNALKNLPDYMLPARFVKMEKFPLTPSGKIDRKSLPDPENKRPDLLAEFSAASTIFQKELVAIWNRHLGLDRIGIDDGFFDLGGTSLMALSMVAELNSTNEKQISIAKYFECDTVRKLASYYENESDLNKLHKIITDQNIVQPGGESRDIAIIAMALRFPQALDARQFWENVIGFKNILTVFKRDELDPSLPDWLVINPDYVPIRGLMPGFDEFDSRFFGVPQREADFMDPQQRKFLELCHEALERAGITPEDDLTVGVFAGVGNNTYYDIVKQHRDNVDRFGEFNVMLLNEKDYVATKTAYKLGLKGPAISIHTACSTSLTAIVEAVDALRCGRCDIALAGGVSINGKPASGHLYSQGAVYSKDETCRPFDHNATGTHFNDGGGVVVLKRLDDAQRDNDEVLAVIKGAGLNNDGGGKLSFMAPSVEGQSEVVVKALVDAKVDASEIVFIEGHGTATPVGDPIEVEALNRAYSTMTDKKQFCYLTSLKSHLGHLTAAAGVASVIRTALSFYHKTICGTQNFIAPNTAISFEETPFKVTGDHNPFPQGKRVLAGVSAFGVGGTNAHIIMEGITNGCNLVFSENVIDSQFVILPLSAKTAEGITVYKDHVVNKINEFDLDLSSADLFLKRRRYKKRIAVIVNRDNKETITVASPFTEPGKLYFMFPGQGGQYVQMGKDLYERNVVFREQFNTICAYVEKYSQFDLRKIIFSATPESGYEVLKNTKFTQPAIFAIEYSLASVYLHLGVVPDGFISHSVGEFAAAVLCGVMSLEDAAELICRRAEMVGSLPGGFMVAVSVSAEKAAKFLDGKVELAAVNAANLVVLCGPHESFETLSKRLDDENIKYKKLHTSHAFHSFMMAPVYEKFRALIQTKKLSTPKSSFEFVSTVTGKVESEILSTPVYWADHIVKPVLFQPALTDLMKHENVIFLEIGPRTTLYTLAHKEATQNRKKDIKVISTMGDNVGNEDEKFMSSLASLYSCGVGFDARKILCSCSGSRTKTVVYPFVKTKHFLMAVVNKQDMNLQISEGKRMASRRSDLIWESLKAIVDGGCGIDIGEYGPEANFIEMGMDSLMLTQLAINLKNEFGVGVAFRDLMEKHSTVSTLIAYFDQNVTLERFRVGEELTEPSEPANIHQAGMAQSVETIIPAFTSSTDGGMGTIIHRQLAIMENQLRILGGGNQVVVDPTSSPLVCNKNLSEYALKSPSSIKMQPHDSIELTAKVNNATTAFGAIARISDVKDISVTPEQRKVIDEFITMYCKKTAGSKEFTQKNRALHADPRVVTGFKPENKEMVYPIVVKESKEQVFIDIDGNEYVDMNCGFGSNFFGNGNEKIKKALKDQLDQGIEIGPQHPLTENVVRLVNELTGNERTAFCNTGSEAVLGAIRIARTVTGRKKVISFTNSYHGIFDEVIVRAGKNGKPYPASPGINPEAVSNMIVLDYATEESLEIIEKNSGEVAAVLVEPVQSWKSDLQPREFLEKVREITLKSGICLIFDEDITGFRVHPAGAQGYFDIRADLCTYGKVIGGGISIGVISGKASFMDALDGGYWKYGDESVPTVGVTYFAGTFVRQPLALAAAKASLEIVREGGKELLDKNNTRGQNYCDAINTFCRKTGAPVIMNNLGSLMKPKWNGNYRHTDLFYALLRFNGVHVYDGFPWFINLAHTDKQIDFVLSVFKKCIRKLQEDGLMPQLEKNNEPEETGVMCADNPPVKGARLGKDPDGNPAWYIEDPENKGKYIRLEGK